MADLRQSAGLCLQSEATQENPQNLSTARTIVLCYVYQTLFPTHTQKKKVVWLREGQITLKLCSFQPPKIKEY